MPSSAPAPRTITEALSAHRLPPSAYATYAPYLTLTARFLGEPPSFYPILALSAPAIRTHVGLFARMFHAPAVDIGLPGHPAPALRRAAFLAASDAAACDYCTAHACAFGDLVRGSIPRQRASASPADPHPCAPLAENLARAAVARPESAARRDAVAVAATAAQAALGAGCVEVLSAVIAFTGALNTVMDIQGVQLEPAVAAFTAKELGTAEKPWAPGGQHAHGPESGASAVRSAPASGMFANVVDLAATLPAAALAMFFEATTLYAGIPYRRAAQLALAHSMLPSPATKFLACIAGSELRRAFLFGLRENFVPPPAAPRCLAASDRARVLFAFARTANCAALCAAAATLLARTAPSNDCDSAAEDAAAAALQRWADAPDAAADAGGALLVAARRLAVAEATGLGNISSELVQEVTSACTPEAVMELASLLSFAEMWRRMLLLFTPPPFE